MFKKYTIFTLLSLFMLNNCGSNGSSSTADTMPPMINLVGDANITVPQFTTYIELGAEAYDNVDGDLPVTIEGIVDNKTPNTYVIQYSATDSSNNTEMIERYVTVVAQNDIPTTEIDIFAIYSPGVKNIPSLTGGDAETHINHLFAVNNEIFTNSKSHTSFNLVGLMEYNIDENSTSTDILNQIATDNTIINLRQENLADEVVIFRPYANDGVCGVAYLNTNLLPQYGYAHVTADCSSKTLSHELGHTLGLDHGYMGGGDAPHLQGLHTYSIGHFVENSFGTVMTYASSYNTPFELVFSNPDLDCLDGQECGILPGLEKEADAVRTILETNTTISEYH